MSAPEQALRQSGDVTDAQPAQTDATEQLGIDPRFTVVDEVDAKGHLGKLVDPFVDMVYPRNEDSDLPQGVIRNSGRWQARHYPDGSGVVESSAGSATYGVRTAAGTIVGNASRNLWFPYNSEYHQRRPDDSGEVEVYDYDWFIEVPFQFVGDVLTMETDLDISDPDSDLTVEPVEGSSVDAAAFMRRVVGVDMLAPDNDERGVLLTHESGVQVYVGWDSTAHRGSETFGFVPFDGDRGVPAPSAEDALDLLRPNSAAAAGGSGVERQGEWFLVPTAEEAEGTIQKPGVSEKGWYYSSSLLDADYETRHDLIGALATEYDAHVTGPVNAERVYTGGTPLDNHLARDWRTVVDDDTFVRRFIEYTDGVAPVDATWTPQDVVDYVEHNRESFDDEVFDDLIEMAEGVQVRGTVRHRRNEHEMVCVDEWRRATTHSWDVVTVDDTGMTRATIYD